MQSSLSLVEQQLRQLLAKTKELEAHYAGEILALEKEVSRALKTVPEPVRREHGREEPTVEEPQLEDLSIKAADELLQELQTKQKMLEHNPRQKLEVKPGEPVQERKPAVPTVHRAERSAKNTPATYIPPRSKNEVTGKVTQTTIRASNKQVFRPELSGLKRSSSRKTTSKPAAKSRQPVEAKQVEEKREEVPSRQELTAKSSSPPPKASLSAGKQAGLRQARREESSKLVTFGREGLPLGEELQAKGQRNRRHILEKLMRECENEERGHRKNEEASRLVFIRHASNHALSRS
jgi:hypothetical protein